MSRLPVVAATLRSTSEKGRSICVSAHAVAWSPLAHAPHKWNPCQDDNPTFPSVADGTAPGPADDLVRPEVPDAFLAGRAECSRNHGKPGHRLVLPGLGHHRTIGLGYTL